MSLKNKWDNARSRWNIFDVPVEDHLQKTDQDKLPQAKLLKDSVHRLEKKITEAYLRGSFSVGEADELSDIDLFLVVEPEKLEDVYNSFMDFLREKYDVVVHCHDRLVKDYGGIGFMFIIKDENDKLFQFDLYLALKGVPPKAYLHDCPRVFSADPEYCWLDESKHAPLPEAAQNFIDRHTNGDNINDELEYQMVDLLVTLNIMKKHIQRGQHARALNDNNHAISVCVQMLQALRRDKSVHTSLYAADKLFKECREDEAYKEIGEALTKAVLEPVRQKKVMDLYNAGLAILRNHAYELYERMESVFKDYDDFVISSIRRDEAQRKAEKRKPAGPSDHGPTL